jgi:hypothetical protein
LGIPIVALELAKVALNSKIECSEVKEHYIITTGAVTKTLRAALRQNSLQDIVQAALIKLSHQDLAREITQCKSMQLNAQEIVKDYILSLDNIMVWSGTEFEVTLINVWSKLTDPLRRYFAIDTVLEQYPRPDFELNAYLGLP